MQQGVKEIFISSIISTICIQIIPNYWSIIIIMTRAFIDSPIVFIDISCSDIAIQIDDTNIYSWIQITLK